MVTEVARGDVIVVHADDLVVGFENRVEEERFLEAFRERLAKFGLELHAEKTRLIGFGRFAAQDRERRGEGKPKTFTFSGLHALLREAPEQRKIHCLAENGEVCAGTIGGDRAYRVT